jgi:hypothetical protein
MPKLNAMKVLDRNVAGSFVVRDNIEAFGTLSIVCKGACLQVMVGWRVGAREWCIGI